MSAAIAAAFARLLMHETVQREASSATFSGSERPAGDRAADAGLNFLERTARWRVLDQITDRFFPLAGWRLAPSRACRGRRKAAILDRGRNEEEDRFTVRALVVAITCPIKTRDVLDANVSKSASHRPWLKSIGSIGGSAPARPDRALAPLSIAHPELVVPCERKSSLRLFRKHPPQPPDGGIAPWAAPEQGQYQILSHTAGGRRPTVVRL